MPPHKLISILMHIYGKKKPLPKEEENYLSNPYLAISFYLVFAQSWKHLMTLRSYSAMVEAIKALQKYRGFDGNTVNVAIFQITVDLKDDQPGL